MSPHEKERNKGMPTPKQKLIHNPIPTSLFLSDMFLLLDEDTAGTIDNFLTKSMFTQTNNKQRCRDGEGGAPEIPTTLLPLIGGSAREVSDLAVSSNVVGVEV